MQQQIAVIGSGMAGLASAYLFQKAGHTVTVFEAQASRGMDSHTLDINEGSVTGWVDVPLRVMSPMAWSSVIKLAAEVGVDTFGVDTFVSCNWMNQKTWFRSSRLSIGQLPFVASWRYLHQKTARLGMGLWQLAQAIQRLEKQPRQELTLADFAREQNFDPLFWRGLVLPLLTTICTCREEHLLAWPAHELLSLFRKIVFGEQLLRLKGGTRAFVQGLSKPLSFVSGSPVRKVQVEADSVLVENQNGKGGRFDRVIVATQANHQAFLDPQLFGRELAALGDIRYDSGELLVHKDPRFMPEARNDWTALNYMMSEDFHESMFTVWVNAVEPSIRSASPIFQTWNPVLPVAPEHVLSRVPLQRAVVHSGTSKALATLKTLHGEAGRKVFFAGSWAHPGVPLLESAVRSAYALLEYQARPQGLRH